MLVIFLLCLTQVTLCKYQHISSFDNKIEQLKIKKPHLFTTPSDTQTVESNHHLTTTPLYRWITYKNTRSLIDICTLLIGLYSVRSAYHHIYTDTSTTPIPHHSMWYVLSQCAGKSITTSITTLNNHILFTKTIVGITIKLVLYKTIIKTILYCGYAILN